MIFLQPFSSRCVCMGESFQKWPAAGKAAAGKENSVRKTEVEAVLESCMKPVLGFALRRCRTAEDAEDLSQEIILKVYRTLLLRDDVEDVKRFVWTVAHNTLCNYYRDTSRNRIGIPLEEIGDVPALPPEETDDDRETVDRLKKEIAYLSEMQRKIVVAYYIDRKKQEQIAREFSLPVGTVKWHLFEAKKELKKGMEKMRENGDLKFNPVEFAGYGINGSFGEKDVFDMFRSPLVQNICYSVRDTWKTVNEIADDMGVSPVYVSGEAAYLAEYGFLKKKGDRYLADMLIDVPDLKIQQMETDMYKAVSDLFANALFDELVAGGVMDSPALTCAWKNDRNFLLWALVPWITACSGDARRDRTVSFEEAATVRKDGGVNIFHAYIRGDLPEGYETMNHWFGPCWNANEKYMLWQLGSEWSENLQDRAMSIQADSSRILALYAREQQEKLSVDEYAWLAERGLIRMNSEGRAEWQILVLETRELREELLAVGSRIREKYAEEIRRLREPYVRALVESVPPHMRKVREFEAQFILFADGKFAFHCIKNLLDSGRLKLPQEAQKKALSTLLMPV